MAGMRDAVACRETAFFGEHGMGSGGGCRGRPDAASHRATPKRHLLRKKTLINAVSLT
jgi:hypothetical protein